MNQELQNLYNVYKNKPIETISSIVEYCKRTNDNMGYFFCGTHYMTTEKDDFKAFEYLYTGLLCSTTKPIAVSSLLSYNLGYLCETCIRNNKTIEHPKYNDIKSCLSFYDLALKYGNYKAGNQLGKIMIDYKDKYKFNINKALEYLILASKNGVVEAMNNLISYYTNINNYEEKVKYMKLKYDLKKDVNDLMILMLEYLNNKDYKKYCNLISELGQKVDVKVFLKDKNILTKEECCICMENKIGYELKCSHFVCSECLFEVFKTNPLCPLCRCEL